VANAGVMALPQFGSDRHVLAPNCQTALQHTIELSQSYSVVHKIESACILWWPSQPCEARARVPCRPNIWGPSCPRYMLTILRVYSGVI
jgi:hypothetical protein